MFIDGKMEEGMQGIISRIRRIGWGHIIIGMSVVIKESCVMESSTAKV